MRGPGRRKKSKSSFSPAHLCLLSVRTESKAPGRDPSQQDYEHNHWAAEGLCNLRPIQNPGVPVMALRDGLMWSSTPTGCVRMYARTELFRNSNMFFSASIHNLTVIRHLMHNPKQYVKTQIFRAAGNPKGLRPFWSF